eukprot:m.537093 g.537093  ORF g.537093 m.537093 type:complete len:63 (-) comp22073_c0_seq5:1057-1245(-)
MELKSAVQKTVSNGWDPQAGNTWQDRLLGGGHVTVRQPKKNAQGQKTPAHCLRIADRKITRR